MLFELTDKEGEFLVKLARKTVEDWDNIIHSVHLKRKRSAADRRVNKFYRYFKKACREWQKGDRGSDELPTIESITSHMPDIADRIKAISDES